MGHTLTDEERWAGGKSWVKGCITVKEIADLTGRSIQTVRNDMANGKLLFYRNKGVLTAEELVSVGEYIKRYGKQ